MKPRIGRKVFCIYDYGILVDEVAFLGAESFIIASLSESTYADSWEWRYEDYMVEWFTSLSKAKKELLSQNAEQGRKFRVVKVMDDWYELEELYE